MSLRQVEARDPAFTLDSREGLQGPPGLEKVGSNKHRRELPGGRHRDIFPLPIPDALAASPVSSSVSRAVRRRVLRGEHDKQLARDAISTLNKTYGCTSHGSEFSNAGQRAAVDNIIATCRAVGAPPVEPSELHSFSKGALSALLDGSALYSSDGGAVASFQRDMVSWPSEQVDPVPLESLASGPVLKQLEYWQYQMLRPESEARALQKEVCPRGPHVDPVHKSSPWRYAEFLSDMSSRGMLSWERAMGRQGNLGLFKRERKVAHSASFSIPELRTAGSWIPPRLAFRPLLPSPPWKPRGALYM